MQEGFNDGFSPRMMIDACEPGALTPEALFQAAPYALTSRALAEALPMGVMWISHQRPVARGTSDVLHRRKLPKKEEGRKSFRRSGKKMPRKKTEFQTASPQPLSFRRSHA
jgi:hypothetical protein